MKKAVNILIVIVLGLIFDFAIPLASVTAQNSTSKNMQKSRNNSASYRDADW